MVFPLSYLRSMSQLLVLGTPARFPRDGQRVVRSTLVGWRPPLTKAGAIHIYH